MLIKVLNPSQVVICLNDALGTQLPEFLDIAKGEIVFMEVQITPIALLCGKFFVTKIDNFIHDLIEHLICIY